jgi:FlaA1/EpsC-like NDP-sugar epimerase
MAYDFTLVRLGLNRLPQQAKNLLMVVADAIVLPLALWSALALRLGSISFEPPPWWAYAATVVVSLPIFLRQGLYRAVIRYLETRAFVAVIGASLAAATLFAALMLALDAPGIPRTSLIIYGVLSAAYAVLARLAAREVLRGVEGRPARQPVAVYGAGQAGRQLVQVLRYSSEFRAVVFVDDDAGLLGRTLMGLPVRSSLDLPDLVGRLDLGAVIVAIPSLTPGRRAALLQRLGALGIEVRLVPSMAELLRGDISVAELRQVHPEDLLGRDAVEIDVPAMRSLLHDQVVMITGAGGSIGSELCRQIAKYRPRCMLLFEISEYALYRLREEMVARWPQVQLVCAVGDVKNAVRVGEVMRAHRPRVVFHAAAYKHVPLMEEVNAWEALRNNTWGTQVVGRAAIEHGVHKFVLVSTDKAVNPTNVMGASKRLAEMVCQALHGQGRTRFEMVRFGNVLGSSGSVIPKFRDQIAKGGPITVTHPDIVRYFMSISEAAQLVLQAGCMGNGGEVFVLDMGEPVRIVDLARNMIRLSGLSEQQIAVEFTGLRPGEKLYEELLADSEFTRPTHHPKIRVAKVVDVDADWLHRLADWVQGHPSQTDDEVRDRIARLLPEYKAWGADTSTPAAVVAFESPPAVERVAG